MKYLYVIQVWAKRKGYLVLDTIGETAEYKANRVTGNRLEG